MAGSRTDVVVSLPRPLTSLIGREHELNHLYELLHSDAALVTITGFGGIGKTRLALQAALELEPDFEAGAIFAPLASVTQGNVIPKAIAITAGLDESIESVPSLADALGTSSRLLVLDNLEQIPDAAEVILSLLQSMPNVTILATSRNRLEINGEYVVPLEPLETQSDNPGTLPSVQLFFERAKAADPSLPSDTSSLDVIAEICQKLDGIPLAIELAAARLAIFSLTDLREQLENILPVLASKRVDLPDRQRTMRNAIAWTYELLDESERRLYTWLSVYEQDFSLESVAHVAHQLELTDDSLDLVQFLVNRSLIRPSRHESSAPRYQMLQMLREFGHEQLLLTKNDRSARQSHAMDMVALAEKAEPHFLASTGKHWMLRLREDVQNLLNAMEWGRSNQQPDVPLRTLGAVWKFIRKSGFSKQFLEHLPDLYDVHTDESMRARALVGAGNLHEVLSQIELAETAFSHVLELTESTPHQKQRVAALAGLALCGHDKSDMHQLEKYANAAQQLAVDIGDDTGRDGAAGLVAMLKIQTGRSAEAVPILTELAAHARARGDTGSEASFSGNLGVALQIEQRYEESQQYILRTIELAEEAGNLYSAAIGYVNLTSASLLLENYDKVKEYGEKGLIVARKANQVITEVSLVNNLACVHWKQKDYGTAAQGLAYAVNLLDTDVNIGQQVQIVSVYVDICMELGMRDEVAELLGAAQAMRKRLNLTAYPWQKAGEESALAELDPENIPNYAALLAKGAELDGPGMVQRMNEITAVLVDLYPPGEPVAEVEAPPDYLLTPRESEVLEMVAQGLTNAEIAEGMFVSTRTVTTHLTNIFTKLDVKNRSSAVAIATEAGLV